MRALPSFLRSTGAAMACSDFCALVLSLAAAYLARRLWGGELPLSDYVFLVPFFLVFLLLYAALGLYPGVTLPGAEELRRLSLGTSVGFLFLTFLLFLGQSGVAYSRFVVPAAWVGALFLVPPGRLLTRKWCAPRPWWGYPVVLFAPPGEDAQTLSRLFDDRESGFFLAELVRTDAGLRVDEARVAETARAFPGAYACVLAGDSSPKAQYALIHCLGRHFRHIAVRFEAAWLQQVSLRAAAFPCGTVAAVRQNLLDPARTRLKRRLDICLCLIAAPFCLLLFPLVALCIRLEDGGPAFFRQTRIGRHGRPFMMLKFRTMRVNGEEMLRRATEQNPALAAELAETVKLARDPRLTRTGKFLRRTSLDELPQLWNVLRGDMSMVGPRPLLEHEVERYGEDFELYARVRPGITGLWQISGRNSLPYERRPALVRYYVYNWSVWLDISILLRTAPAVLGGRGAC